MQTKGVESIEEILISIKDYVEKKIQPRANEIDQKEILPREIIDELAGMGVLGACIPEEYGGLGMDYIQYGRLTEIIGKVCSSTRSLLTVHTSLIGDTLVKRANAYQKERYLPDLSSGKKIWCFALSEPQIGSDASSVQTTYERLEDSFVLNGQKKWITFGEIADFYLVFAQDNGTISSFIVERETPGVSVKPIKGMLGGRGSHMAEIFLKNVKIPEENLLGNIGQGFSFIANTALTSGRYSIAWAGLAIAQAALEEMVNYARVREQFGQKIGSFQLVKAMIADAVTQIHAARALCLRAGELLNKRDNQAVMETNIAKYFTSKVALQVAADAVQIFGGKGCSNEYPVERLFRESKILEIIEGTSQIQQIMIGDFGLRKYRSTK